MDDFLVHSLQLTDPECLRTCHGTAATTQEQRSPKARPLPCLWSGACHRQVLFPSSVSLCCWAISALVKGGGLKSFHQGHEGVRRAYSCQESSIPSSPIVPQGQSSVHLSKRDAGDIPVEGWALNSSPGTSDVFKLWGETPTWLPWGICRSSCWYL